MADQKELDQAKKELDRVNTEYAHLNAQVSAMTQELSRKTDEIREAPRGAGGGVQADPGTYRTSGRGYQQGPAVR